MIYIVNVLKTSTLDRLIFYIFDNHILSFKKLEKKSWNDSQISKNSVLSRTINESLCHVYFIIFVLFAKLHAKKNLPHKLVEHTAMSSCTIKFYGIRSV